MHRSNHVPEGGGGGGVGCPWPPWMLAKKLAPRACAGVCGPGVRLGVWVWRGPTKEVGERVPRNGPQMLRASLFEPSVGVLEIGGSCLPDGEHSLLSDWSLGVRRVGTCVHGFFYIDVTEVGVPLYLTV